MTEYGSWLGGLFGGRANFEGKDAVFVDDTVRSGQIRLAALIWIMEILCGLSIFIGLVAGYCVGGGAAGVTWSAMPHVVWVIPNLFVLFLAIQAIYLGTDTDIASGLVQMAVCMWFIMLVGILNLVEFLSVCFEVNNANSTFWLQNGGAWVWVQLFGYLLFVLWDALIAWHLFVYRYNMENAHYRYGWMPSGVKAGALGDIEQQLQLQQTPDLTSTVSTPDASPQTTTTAPTTQARIKAKFTQTGALVVGGGGDRTKIH
jgi:hypothetical protein